MKFWVAVTSCWPQNDSISSIQITSTSVAEWQESFVALQMTRLFTSVPCTRNRPPSATMLHTEREYILLMLHVLWALSDHAWNQTDHQLCLFSLINLKTMILLVFQYITSRSLGENEVGLTQIWKRSGKKLNIGLSFWQICLLREFLIFMIKKSGISKPDVCGNHDETKCINNGTHQGLLAQGLETLWKK